MAILAMLMSGFTLHHSTTNDAAWTCCSYTSNLCCKAGLMHAPGIGDGVSVHAHDQPLNVANYQLNMYSKSLSTPPCT